MACAASASLTHTSGEHISLFPQVSPDKAPRSPRQCVDHEGRQRALPKHSGTLNQGWGERGGVAPCSAAAWMQREAITEKTRRRARNEETRRRCHLGLRSHNKANEKGRSHARHAAGSHARRGEPHTSSRMGWNSRSALRQVEMPISDTAQRLHDL